MPEDHKPFETSDWPSLERGAAIGRYVVLGLVGRGAMGEVYAAYDPELDRKVAVKLLRTGAGTSDLTAEEARARLLREAQAIARLSHPNVIVVHDVGSFGDRVFVAMEFVDGNTVGYWLLAATRSWREVLRVFMAAGQGLAAAHASQLVHRDFKLDNVMLGRDGQVRVMDFGLARRVSGGGPSASAGVGVAAVSARHAGPAGPATPSEISGTLSVSDPALTATRVITPLTATGGRAGGHAGTLAAAGLGASFSASVRKTRTSVLADSMAELEATPMLSPTVSGRPSQSLTLGSPRDGIPHDLTQTGAIVGTPAYMAPEQFEGGAADERSDQFSFCVALYEGLYGQRPFAGKNVIELSENVRGGRLSPASDPARVPGWLRRVVARGLRRNPDERWPSMDALLEALRQDPTKVWRRWALVAAASAGVAGIGMAARRQGALENRPTCQVPGDRFAHIWEPRPSPGSRRAAIVTAFRSSGQPYAADALSGVGRLLDSYVEAWSSMYRDSCEATNLRGEQSAEVLDLRMSCLRERLSAMRALSDVLADPSSEVVVNAVKAAAALTPIETCADERTLRAAVPPPHDPVIRQKVEGLRTRLATAKALQDAGRFVKAASAVAPLVAEARATGYVPVLADALYRLAETQMSLGKPATATVNYDEAIWTAQTARYDELVASASIEQIFIAGAIDLDLPRARRWFRQAEAFLARMEGHDLLRSWMDNNLGAALDAHGEREEAAARYRKALETKERVLGSEHPDVALSLTNLAMALGVLDRPGEALELSNRGVRIMEATLGLEHPETATQWSNRAEILNQLGRYGEARRDAERARAVWEKELGPASLNLPFCLGPLGEALLGLGLPDEAVAPLERAVQIAEKSDMRFVIPELKFTLARALWESGQDHSRAVALGLQASSPVVSDGALDRTTADRHQDVRQRAAAWVAGRQAGVRRGKPMAGRLTRRGPTL